MSAHLTATARTGHSPIARRAVLAVVAHTVLAARTALMVCTAFAAGLSIPVAAQATESETVAAIKPSFSPDRLGAKAAFTFEVRFTGGELGVPSPVRRAVVQLPPGLSMNIPHLSSCTRARLQARGASGCPARSLIGTGHALADVHAGASVESEEAKVWAFLGPPQGLNPTIEILGQGYTPLDERVVITATVLPSRSPLRRRARDVDPRDPLDPLRAERLDGLRLADGRGRALPRTQPEHGPAAHPLSCRRLSVRDRIRLRRRLHEHHHRDRSVPVEALPQHTTRSVTGALGWRAGQRAVNVGRGRPRNLYP